MPERGRQPGVRKLPEWSRRGYVAPDDLMAEHGRRKDADDEIALAVRRTRIVRNFSPGHWHKAGRTKRSNA